MDRFAVNVNNKMDSTISVHKVITVMDIVNKGLTKLEFLLFIGQDNTPATFIDCFCFSVKYLESLKKKTFSIIHHYVSHKYVDWKP